MYRYISFVVIFLSIMYISHGQGEYSCDIEINKKAQKLYDKARKASKKGDRLMLPNIQEAIEVQDDWAAPYYYLGLQVVKN